MCKRSTNDPLLRTFLDDYQLHLLSIPREGAAVGDAYVEQGKHVASPGNLASLFDPPLAIPNVVTGEVVAAISGKATRGVDAGAGLGLLEGFVRALGGGAASGQLRAKYAAKGTRTVSFRFTEVRRDRVDVTDLGTRLEGHRLRANHPLLDLDSHIYVATAVFRASSIAVRAEREGGQSVDVDVEGLSVAEATGSIAVNRSAEGEVLFEGKKRLAFGVELFEISYDEAERRFRMVGAQKPMKLRAGGETGVAGRRWIGGLDGDVMIRLDE